jgi:hypothetical protein
VRLRQRRLDVFMTCKQPRANWYSIRPEQGEILGRCMEMERARPHFIAAVVAALVAPLVLIAVCHMPAPKPAPEVPATKPR